MAVATVAGLALLYAGFCWVLHEQRGKKIAVIENEFGEVGIDDGLLAKNTKMQADEEIIEMMNGCICCTVRQDLIGVLQKLEKRVKSGNNLVDGFATEARKAEVMARVVAGGFGHAPSATPPKAGKPLVLTRAEYGAMFGPTVGDKVKLGICYFPMQRSKGIRQTLQARLAWLARWLLQKDNIQ